MKNCIDCENLKAKIPLKPIIIKQETKFTCKQMDVKNRRFKKEYIDKLIEFDKATVYCSAGMIIMHHSTKDVKDKTFKNVLRLGKLYKNKTFAEQAPKCKFFRSMDDEQG